MHVQILEESPYIKDIGEFLEIAFSLSHVKKHESTQKVTSRPAFFAFDTGKKCKKNQIFSLLPVNRGKVSNIYCQVEGINGIFEP